MNKEQFARLVFAHLGQAFQGLDQSTYDTQLFLQTFQHSLRMAIFQGSPAEFARPFIPKRLKSITAEDNPYRGRYYISEYPESLITILNHDENSASRFVNPSYGAYKTIIDQDTKSKVILSPGERPRLIGLFFFTNLAYWSAQAIETAALHCAWTMAPQITKSTSRRRELKRDYMEALTDLKIYSSSNQDGDLQEPAGEWTDVIDFDQGFYNRHLFGLL